MADPCKTAADYIATGLCDALVHMNRLRGITHWTYSFPMETEESLIGGDMIGVNRRTGRIRRARRDDRLLGRFDPATMWVENGMLRMKL